MDADATKRSWRASDAEKSRVRRSCAALRGRCTAWRPACWGTAPSRRRRTGSAAPVWTNAPRWQPVAKFRTGSRASSSISVSTANAVRPGSRSSRRRAYRPPAGDPVCAIPEQRARAVVADASGNCRSASAPIVLVYREGMACGSCRDFGHHVSAVETLLARGKTALRHALKDDGE